MTKMMTILMIFAAFVLVTPLAHSADKGTETSEYKYGKKFTPINTTAVVEQKGKANLNGYRYGKKHSSLTMPKN